MQMVTSWAKALALLQTAPASCDSTRARSWVCRGDTRAWGGDAGSPTGIRQPRPQSHPPNPLLLAIRTLTPTSPRSPGCGTHLEEGDDEGSQWEVGGLLELGVELLDGERGVLRGQPGLSAAGRGPPPALHPPEGFFAVSPPFLLLCQLCHAQGKATLEGKPRSRENHAQGFAGNASTRDPTLHRAVQIPGDAGKTAPIFPGFRSVQH